MSTIALVAPARSIAPRRPATQPAHKPVRLTRRGLALVRALIVASVLTVVLAVSAAIGGLGAWAGTEPGTPVATTTYVVMPGESLWAVASEVSGGKNVQAMIDEIRELNGLSGSRVSAGQRLLIPSR